MRWFDDLQRMSTSPANALASRIARQQVDLAGELPRITAPTLILQSQGDRSTTFDNAVEVSAAIQGSRLVALDSRNHILLADEPAWATFVTEVTDFLEPDRRAPGGAGPAFDALTPRELDVLERCAEGRTNEDIAESLTLSPRTVERHLSNIYGKLGPVGDRRSHRSRRRLPATLTHPRRLRVGPHRGGGSCRGLRVRAVPCWA